MKTEKLLVSLAERSYPIFIGPDLLPRLGDLFAKELPSHRCVLVGDSHTLPLYGELCQSALSAAQYQVSCWQFPAGETSKNLGTLAQLYDFLVQENLDRHSFLIALGGGVTGDLSGFAAATYLRGIPFLQIPTTLLAQVDSSVGGKTAVNLSGGKNLVGSFYQPRGVLCDVSLLKTLPPREISCGLAEVIKYGIILDAAFFSWLENEIPSILRIEPDSLTYTVRHSCELKAQITAEDEREGGRRAILNFGHTLAHAIEQVYGYGTYSHGEAVAVGELFACRLSEELLGFSKAETLRVHHLLEAARLPVSVPAKDVAKRIEQLIDSCRHDKKSSEGEPRFVLAEKLGQVRFGCRVPKDLLRKILAEFVHQS